MRERSVGCSARLLEGRCWQGYGLMHILSSSAAGHLDGGRCRCVRCVRKLMEMPVPMLDWSLTRGEKGCYGC